MDKRFLVLVHAQHSPLPAWWQADTAHRSWDLLIVDGSAAGLRQDGTGEAFAVRRPGPKWPALAEVLLRAGGAWQAYEHVAIADAGVQASSADIDRMFAAAAALQLPLAQPALAADGAAADPLLQQHPGCTLRFTDRLDPALAVYRRDTLLAALPLLATADDEALLGRRLPQLLADPTHACAVLDGIVVRRPGHPPTAADPTARCLGGFDLDGRRFGAEGPHGAAATVAAPAASDTPVLATVLDPADGPAQRQAVAAWLAQGCTLVSFNRAEQVDALRRLYPALTFVDTGTTDATPGQVFAWFRAQGLRHGGFVRADQPGLARDAALHAAPPAGSLHYVRSVGTLHAFFWDAGVLTAYEGLGDGPAIGAPHADHWLLLLPLARGFTVQALAAPTTTVVPMTSTTPPAIDTALALFEQIALRATCTPAQDPRLKTLLKTLLPQRGRTATPADAQALDAALHATLDLWFDDVIERHAAGEAVAALPGEVTAQPAAAPAAEPTAHTTAPSTRDAATDTAAPEISVIVPTFNRAPILARCLEHLARQTLAPERFEVIVVDDGSADDTPAVLAGAPAALRLRTLRQANLGPAAARNRALEIARAPWVLFLNDDALLVPEALQIHLDEHARRGPRDAVLGRFPMDPEFTPTTRPVGWCMDHTTLAFDYPNMQPGPAYGFQHFYTCNLSLAREFVIAHGGFDEGFVRMGAEDIELGLRLQQQGCRVFYRPDCVARHAHRLDSQGLARMFEFRGRGGVHLFVAQPQLLPHYAEMPVARIEQLQAQHGRLQPALARLHRAIARADALPCQPTGDALDVYDDPAAKLDFRTLWLWSEDHVQRFVDAIATRIERHADAAAAQQRPSLEQAVRVVYPALNFLKWYHDTLGVVGSDELRGYLERLDGQLPWAA